MTDDTSDTTTMAAGGDAGDLYMQEINNLTHLVAEARQLVQEGNVIDMSNFQERVGELCKAIAANPPADVDGMMAAIQRLVGDLNTLASDLKTLHPGPDA